MTADNRQSATVSRQSLRIDSIFAECATRGRAALMPFITAGFPSMDVTLKVIPALENAGASIIEIGFPFSDPIADGPVIAASMHQALQAGVTPDDVLDKVRDIRPHTNMGLVGMVSDSIITRMGPERFVCDASAAGLDGLIVPDIDLDAARPLAGLAKIHGLGFTLLIAPTTTPARMAMIAELCSGFIYLLARVGITGESQSLEFDSLRNRIAQVRNLTTLPIAVGFGISKPEHVAAVSEIADGVIVGSALVRCMAEADEPVAAATRLITELAGGTHMRCDG
jgi:tryptophan synthase alpha chain